MSITELGMLIDVRLLQYVNAISPITATPSDMTTVVKFSHPKKALSLILKTVPGIVTDVRSVPQNALGLILVIVYVMPLVSGYVTVEGMSKLPDGLM